MQKNFSGQKEDPRQDEYSISRIRIVIQKYPVTFYFLITFIISWGIAISIVGLDGIPGTIEEQDRLLNAFVFSLLAGPIVGGFLTTSMVYGKNGIREYYFERLKLKVHPKWYLIAILGAPLIGLITLFPLIPLSNSYIPAILSTDDRMGLILTGLMIGISAGLFEELGWSGFATPELLKSNSWLKTGLIIGIFWGIWHFITAFWGAGDELGNFVFEDKFLPMMTFYIVVLPAFRILMVWVYENTKNLFILILMHSSLTGNVIFILLDPELNGFNLFRWYIVFAIPLWVLVIILAKYSKR